MDIHFSDEECVTWAESKDVPITFGKYKDQCMTYGKMIENRARRCYLRNLQSLGWGDGMTRDRIECVLNKYKELSALRQQKNKIKRERS